MYLAKRHSNIQMTETLFRVIRFSESLQRLTKILSFPAASFNFIELGTFEAWNDVFQHFPTRCFLQLHFRKTHTRT